MTRKNKKLIYNIIACVLTIGAIAWVCEKFIHLGNVEFTENAQVKQLIVPVNSRVQGFIKEVRFDEYTPVKKGDTLVVIEDAEYRFRVAQAEAGLENARTGKDAMHNVISTTHTNLTVTDAGIDEARIHLENAERNYNRFKALYEKNAVTKQQYDDMHTAYSAAKARYEMLNRQKESVRSVSREQNTRLGQNEAGIKLAEAALELARLNLSYTVVLAPCDSYTGRKEIQEGQLIQPGQTLVNLVDAEDKWVVANYKETQTAHIRLASVLGFLSLALNLWRASFLRHPYISLAIFKIPLVLICVTIILLMDLLLAPSHIFEHALMEGVLGYDHENVMTLNWIAMIGVVIGIVFTWQTFARRKWMYQRMLVIAFSCFALYLAYFYFRIDYDLPKEALYFPVIIRSAGYVMVAVMMLTANARLPFPFIFLHGLCFQNMFSAALAGPIGNAIVGRALTVVMARNSMLLGERLDAVTLSTIHIPFGELYGMVQVQSLLESMKEIYGWLLLVAILCLIGLMLRHSDIRPQKVIEPTYRVIHQVVQHSIRYSVKIRNKTNLTNKISWKT